MEDAVVRGNARMEKRIVGERIESVGWALFFLMSGAILLIPDVPNPWGAWLLGTGLILVGVNVAQYTLGMRPNVLVTGFGAIAIVAGAAEYAKVDLPILALCLLLVGAAFLVKPLTGRSVLRA